MRIPRQSVFFNAGEANEAAIKLPAVRKGERFEISRTLNSFNGRTMGSAFCHGQAKHQKGFAAPSGGVCGRPVNDIEAIKQALNERTVAVMIELSRGRRN